MTNSSYSEFSYNESTNETRLAYKTNFTGTNFETRSDYEYDARGNITRETVRYTGSSLARPKDRVMKYEYDEYGNRTRSINASESQNRITETVYDDVLHQYAVKSISYGDITLATSYEINYASAFGAAQKKTDPNGWSVYYDFDAYGRLARQRLDTDNGTETLAEYEYAAPAGRDLRLSAKVTQYTGDGNKKETRVYVDGMGRVLHSVWSATDDSGKKYAKSGLITYDAMGRVVRKGQTQWATGGDIDSYSEPAEINPTITAYDPASRVAKVTLPKNSATESETSTTYTYNDPWETIVTHSIGRSKRTVKNARGLVLYVEDSGTGDDGKTLNANIGFLYDDAGNRIKKMDLNTAAMTSGIDNSLFAVGAKDASGNNVAQWRYDGFGQLIETSDPDLGYSKAEYNGYGEVTDRTDAQGRVTHFAYDKLGRMTLKNLPGAEGNVSYVYDTPFGSAQGPNNSKGKLTSIDDPAQVKRLTYDKVGRVSHEEREIKGTPTTFETDFTYDLLNRTKTIQYPVDPATQKRITTEYYYCAYGVTGIRITQGIFRNKNIVKSVSYNEFGQMDSIARGNDSVTTYEYDVRGRLSHLVTRSGGREIQNVKYDFRIDNNIAAKEDTTGEGDASRKVRYEYSYDGLNRLVDSRGSYLEGTDEASAKKYHHTYGYSLNGNMTQKTMYDSAGAVDDRWTYSYASAPLGTGTSGSSHAVSAIHSSKSGNRFEMRYDGSGNMVYQADAAKKITKEISYDSSNRITKVIDPVKEKQIGEYAYDDQGFRVRKVAAEIINGAEAQVEVLYPSMYFAIEKQRTSSGEEIPNTAYASNNIYLNGIRIAASLPNGECQYYLTDQVDSVSIVTDDAGKVLTRTEYLPYGETWIQSGESRNRPKFNSQELDAETNYYFYNARYYDGEIGRFITADSVVPYEDDTQSWNRYSY
ncbi:MAG TPA: RHS repeat-associated core domain-containing protein, partial [Candidatus Paceibacterota bacterium]